MNTSNIFKPGDSVNYQDGMEFKDFTGTIESCIQYKDTWHYLVKDQRNNSVKRVGERSLSLVKSNALQKLNKFAVGESVCCTNERESFSGVIEKAIHNYLGHWQYIVKDTINKARRIDEKNLKLIPLPLKDTSKGKF